LLTQKISRRTEGVSLTTLSPARGKGVGYASREMTETGLHDDRVMLYTYHTKLFRHVLVPRTRHLPFGREG
jgi:hypothetical protein